MKSRAAIFALLASLPCLPALAGSFQRLAAGRARPARRVYVTPPGKVDVCAVPAPVRDSAKP